MNTNDKQIGRRVSCLGRGGGKNLMSFHQLHEELVKTLSKNSSSKILYKSVKLLGSVVSGTEYEILGGYYSVTSMDKSSGCRKF